MQRLCHLGVFMLILVVLIQLFGRTAMAGYFFLEKEYVAQTLCEQRDVPGNQCQGKCQVRRLFEGERQFAPGTARALIGSMDSVDAFVVERDSRIVGTELSANVFHSIPQLDHGVMISPCIDSPPRA